MKKLIIIAILLIASTAGADQYVNGYYRENGTYVMPHVRSSPDSNYNNNYGTQGNYNPYTGNKGLEAPTFNQRTPEYNQKHYGDTMQQTDFNHQKPLRPRW